MYANESFDVPVCLSVETRSKFPVAEKAKIVVASIVAVFSVADVELDVA